MFFRFRQVSFTALLLILLLQLVFSPLLLSLNLGQKEQAIADKKGSFTPKNEPFFVGQKEAKPHQYSALARELKRVAQAQPEAVKPAVVDELKQSIQKEMDVAKQAGAPLLRRLEYENWLKEQVRQIDPNPSFTEKTLGVINSGLVSVGSVFSKDDDSVAPAPKETILIPAKPSTFKFSDIEVKVQTLVPPADLAGFARKDLALVSMFKKARQAFASLWQASPVLAQEQSGLPALADVKADVSEVIIDSSIESLAAELNYNPVALTNYVRSNVKYEPYFGAQKGSVGCLRQLLCNDVDTASLTIALLRASGIPGRYKHSFVRVPVAQLKTLLGVDQVKTVYVALTNAGLSPKLVNTSIPEGAGIDTVDLESETQLALEWTWAESYLEYDERGGNISFASTKDAIAGFVDDVSLRVYLSAFPKKQWLAIDSILNRSITRTRNAIAADSAGIDAKQFWLNYYQYQGTSAPVAKFLADINNSVNSSFSLTANKNNYDILPPALPYSIVPSADNNGGTTVLTAPYSVLPAAWRQTVVISLKSQDNSQTFLNKTFFASEINNQPVYLRYNGATQTDADVIASYGGLASTPAPLVQIVPYLEFAGQLQSGSLGLPIHIGDTLVLETALSGNGAVIQASQKFSIAGNEEGIFIAFSSIAPDANLDNLNESGLLAQGTAALARKYLQRLQTARNTLSDSLDYTAVFKFMRAIVTQNRSLNTFEGFPATFDFSGLTMDAATDVNDYSRRDNYKNHRDYFRLVFGLEASRYEGQLFTDVAGLDGISTVSGLQYAYAHPETYTVRTITSANQGEIVGLNISPNVKQQITNAVAAGATAVVPDKNIVKGNFQGILYALLKADGTGQYAIGEQVVNGGYTSDHYEIINVLINGQQYAQFINRDQANPDNFIYQDEKPDSPARTCRIPKTTFLDIANNEGWQESYGLPCLKEQYNFGAHDYTFIMTLNAAKFKSTTDSVNYWRTNSFMRAQIALSVPMANVATHNLFPYWGTYVYENKASKKMAIYNPQQLIAHTVEGKIYEKYVGASKVIDQYVPALLGYPKGNQGATNAYTPSGTEGNYQQFTNGTAYQITKNFWYDDIYIVIAGIEARHNSLNGTTGMGFPLDDPQKSFGQANTIFQNFENGEKITYTLDTHITTVADTAQKISFTRLLSAKEWREFAEGVQDAFFDIGIYGVGVNLAAGASLAYVKPFIEKLALKLGKKAATKVVIRFVPLAGWAFAGITTGLAAYDNAILADACSQDPDTDVNSEGEPPAYYCGRLTANTAAFAIGATLGAAKRSGKINLFGVRTDVALEGKALLNSRIKTGIQFIRVQNAMQDNPLTRTAALEAIKKIGASNIDDLLNDATLLNKFFASLHTSTFVGNSQKIITRKHTFSGIVENGEAKGFHHYRSRGPNTDIIPGTKTPVDQYGVYEAYVKIEGVNKVDISSFFPDNMPEEEVERIVNKAYAKILSNKSLAKVDPNRNVYKALVDDFDIRMFLDNNDKFTSTYPQYRP